MTATQKEIVKLLGQGWRVQWTRGDPPHFSAAAFLLQPTEGGGLPVFLVLKRGTFNVLLPLLAVESSSRWIKTFRLKTDEVGS